MNGSIPADATVTAHRRADRGTAAAAGAARDAAESEARRSVWAVAVTFTMNRAR